MPFLICFLNEVNKGNVPREVGLKYAGSRSPFFYLFMSGILQDFFTRCSWQFLKKKEQSNWKQRKRICPEFLNSQTRQREKEEK